jgi:hypothetical protein
MNSEFFTFLHQHPDGIFQKLCQFLHELGSVSAVADAMVNGDDG